MNNLGTITLETERLILRKFNIKDAEGMFNNWASDNEVTKFLSWPTHKSINDTKGYINWIIEQYENDTTYDWIIEFKETKEVIGSIGAVSVNDNINSVHIGYCISKKMVA